MANDPKLNILFEPITLGTVKIANRLTMAAMTRNRAPDTVPGELMQEFCVQRVRGGCSLIVTDGILVSRQGTEWAHAPGIWDKDVHVPAWKKIVDAVHAEGGIIFAQLWHAGRACHPDTPQQKLRGEPVYAPSAIRGRSGKFRMLPGAPGFVTPEELPDPWTVIEEFRQAAVNAKMAGFDGVEIHGANGYLLHEFIDSTANKRTDEWGGSIEARAKFPLETIKAVQETWGPNVGYKVTPCGGYNDMGMPLKENLATYKYFFTEADKLNIAYFSVVRYTDRAEVVIDGAPRSTKHDVIESYRSLCQNAKFMVGAEVQPEEGAELVRTGKADVIAIGMLWVNNPDLVHRVQHGKALCVKWDIEHLQGGRGHPSHIGYTDYPRADYDD